MIKFFRKIRYDLMEKNKTGKYLKYAIGEVILVVIGILIALWINNKNQEYNNGKIARIYLEDFKRDLEADINTLEEKILRNEKFIKNADSIIIASQKDVLSEKENNSFFSWVNSLMGETYYVPEKTTIRQFESSNSSHLITSKTLKDQLFSYYTANDVNENNFEKSIQLYQHNFLTKDLFKVYKNFNQNPASPNIIAQKFSEEFELATAIYLKKDLTTNQNKQYRKFKEKAEDLIKLINSELE
ncbi:DUF6090 family protein [Winogradskyella vincentii]|uniref:Uncharacterized protein n=1 Tax=Winogradskyella vincentii TaxID=2877122 RepID=A0ABS7Y2X3_9FLAO|nr:DUF6090 family protein [Winogradskyella vincentii]MCA0154271.1 hypothetical protein [Winogradskyella vincentii]